MRLRCNHCGHEFSREEGANEAELAYRRGEDLGDFVCPECGSGDHMVEEVYAMPLIDFLGVLYEETPVEICVDYDPVYSGLAENVPIQKFMSSRVLEAYISLDGKTLVISINGQRNVKKK